MIVMNLEVDNLMDFRNFKINFSYPKKIVNSPIDFEYLKSKTNFRYKKVNIIMGSNASGKTSLGRVLMIIFNFISRGKFFDIENFINDKSKNITFSIDFLINDKTLYRICCDIKSSGDVNNINHEDVKIDIYSSKINKRDSYEMCVKKLSKIEFDSNISDIEKLKIIPKFGWYFELTDGTENKFFVDDESYDLNILEKILKVLDSDIKSVKKLENFNNSFYIEKSNDKIIIQDGKLINDNKLSSGTKAGIPIAKMLSAITRNSNGFYYCDEKFSFVHTEIEKAILSIMISRLKDNCQLFFTTHNSEILEMNLPKHSFTFLRKKNNIEAVYPQDYIKKGIASLYYAVKNDVFSCEPDTDELIELEDIDHE